MPDDRSLMTAAQLPLECSNNNRATVLSLQRLQTQNRPLLFNFEATTNSREHPKYKCKISIFWLIWQNIHFHYFDEELRLVRNTKKAKALLYTV